ncbi:hypothetical protein MJH12_17985 [bacterium]|nr:hypothetical protein [bacterium]
MKFYIQIFILLTLMTLSGCGSIKEEAPRLEYLVAYSVLDNHFKTSSRLDLTADILNLTSEEMENATLEVIDAQGNRYSLNYDTIGTFSQEGRFGAFPLKAPISNLEIGGKQGEEFISPSDLHFLFMNAFEEATISYRNKSGIHKIKVDNLNEVISRSRRETMDWMQKEYDEQQKLLADLEDKAKPLVEEWNKKTE